ncbi:MAG: rubredoxin [Aquimonas sp.]|nr:rubredoxin [Aquimonas sp.]
MSSVNPHPAGTRHWMCVVCGFIYSEAVGLPEDGIPAGTAWEDIPETWLCPDCGVTKADFEMVEIEG